MGTLGWLLILIDVALAVGFSLIVLSRKKRIPSVTLAWIFSFFFLPYLGFLLFALLGYRNLRLRKRRNPKSLRQSWDRSLSRIDGIPVSSPPEFSDPEMARLARLCGRLTGLPAVGSNEVYLNEEAEDACRSMLDAIASAKKHIHLEFYIFQPDETGLLVRDALIEKARQGIECRVLLDTIGSFALKNDFIAPLRAAGAAVHFFGHGAITRPWGIQLRNHRKILVVDGVVGFTGSQNIGNEYNRGRKGELSWRDTQVRLRGPAVHQLQKVFAEDWQFTTGENLHLSRYFPIEAYSGRSIVQTLPTGPDEKPDTLEMILIHLIHQATERVTVITPYFIPSVPLVLALESASQRGVRVDVLVPRRSDSWIVDRASRSWFSDLIGNGIHIYEYSKAFVHAKVVTIDGKLCLLGSANMDERSFKLNFECSLVIYDANISSRLLESFEVMRAKARPILFTRYRKQRFLTRVTDGLFRILSPLL